MRDICHSGGARGADSVFSKCAYDAGHDVWHMSFIGHHHEAQEGLYNILTVEQLRLADPFLERANETLDRFYPTRNAYTQGLLRRNYYQIKDVERVYAVAPIDTWGIVFGGTAWAVQMAIDARIPEIYVFDIFTNKWCQSRHVDFGCQWENYEWEKQPPKPFGRYTGIGSREISSEGRKAIQALYKQ